MSHRRRHHRNHMDFDDFGRHGGIFDLVFGIVSMVMDIVLGVITAVFDVIGAMFSFRPRFDAPHSSNGANSGPGGCCNNNPNSSGYNNGSNYNSTNNSNHNSANYSSSSNNTGYSSSTGQGTQNADGGTASGSTKTQPPKETAGKPSKDGRKKTEKQGNDWNVMIFVFTIIFGVAALASGHLAYAGLIAAAGIMLMLIYSTVRGIRRSIKSRAAAKAKAEAEKQENEDKEEDSVEKLIKEAFEKVFSIRKDLHLVTRPEIKQKVELLCDLAEDIIGEARTNAESLQAVKKFFYYYLDAFGEIFRKYLRISNFSESSEEIAKTVAETEKSFNDIEGIFKGLLEKMLEKDVMGLKAEINVIKNSG